MATTTFQSNLTHNDGDGSTVTAAATSKSITPTSLTSAHILSLQSIDPAASGTFETIALGDVTVTAEHAVRLRNAGYTNAGGSSVQFIELAVQTAVSTFTVIGRIYAGETWGPCRMTPQVSSYPRLVARAASTTIPSVAPGNAAVNLEVIACDMGTPTT